MEDRMLYNTREAAHLLHVSRTTLYALVKSGVLGHLRSGARAKLGPTNIYIPKEEVEKYIKDRVQHGYETSPPPEILEKKRQLIAEAREAKKKKALKKKGHLPLEDVKGTIYELKLKPITFNKLHAHGLLTIKEVDFESGDVPMSKLMGIRGFGVACRKDLAAALRKYHTKEARKNENNGG